MADEIIRNTINLPLPEVLKSLVEMEVGGHYFDLHNDYECYKLVYNDDKRECSLFFRGLEQEVDSDYAFIDITLVDAIIESDLSVLEKEQCEGFNTIDTFYRGRFEDGNKLREIDGSGRSLYYISFYSGIEFCVFASGLQIKF